MYESEEIIGSNLRLEKLEWLHFVRNEELKQVIKFFPPPKKDLKILEIGGGDGYLASELEKMGYDIVSLDVNPSSASHYPVIKTIGSNLDFDDDIFDVIFSSNVLEHIQSLNLTFDEIHRVSKKDCTIIHTVPTTSWRLVTSVIRITLAGFNFISRIYHNIRSIKSNIVNTSLHNNYQSDDKKFIKRNIMKVFLHPHGVYKNAFYELYYFSKFRWKKEFIAADFFITHYEKTTLFYSGHSIFKFRFLSFRRYLARIGFCACHLFVMKRFLTNSGN